jgi:hypothetical protein
MPFMRSIAGESSLFKGGNFATTESKGLKMNHLNFSIIQDLITGFYAAVCIYAPFRVSWWAVAAIVLSALLGLLPV